MDRDPPDFRATVRGDGVVRLIDWAPWLADSGPLYTLIDGRARAGVAIADLTVLREGEIATEVIVDFRCGGAPAHRDARQLRLDRQLSQREAAERAGLDQPTWSRLERGEMTLTLEHALRIQYALGIPTLEALIGPLPSQLT